MPAERYRHTQTSPARLFLALVILVALIAGWVWRTEFWAWFSMAMLAGVTLFVALTMTTLTTEDIGDALFVYFGPVSLFSTRIRYDEIQEAKATRSRIIDGWGLHYIPGRGWTWNLWGFDCVDIRRADGQIFRIGSDDAEHLAKLIQSKMTAA